MAAVVHLDPPAALVVLMEKVRTRPLMVFSIVDWAEDRETRLSDTLRENCTRSVEGLQDIRDRSSPFA